MVELELQTPTVELNLLMDKFMYVFRPMVMELYRGIYPEDVDHVDPERFYATLVTILCNSLTDMAYVQKEDPARLLRCFNEYWITAHKSLIRELAVRNAKLN